MVPFYGQGMNAGFEDVLILDQLFDQHSNIETIFDEFSRIRHPQAVSICDLAICNYQEMSSSVVSYKYLIEKKITNVLHHLFPKSIIPLYTMVAFTTIPYDQVVKKRDSQHNLVKKLEILFGSLGIAGLMATAFLVRKLVTRNN